MSYTKRSYIRNTSFSGNMSCHLKCVVQSRKKVLSRNAYFISLICHDTEKDVLICFLSTDN